MKKKNSGVARFRVADLFCGVGGLSLGFGRAGFGIVVGVDGWKEALSVYAANFDHETLELDISRVDEVARCLRDRRVNAIIGGPPCQDFSHAGKRSEGGRADLTESFALLCAETEPEFFVMENVERARASSAYARARDIFRNGGFGVTETVLDAALCGVPQRRKRFFCIGVRGENDGFLDRALGSRLGTVPMTVRDHFGDALGTDYYYRHPRNYSRRGVYSLDEPSATIRGVNRPIPPNYKKHPKDAADISRARVLSTKERAMIQTFPRGFRWSGSKTQLEQMIGNAVPVNLANFIATCLSDFLRGTGVENEGRGVR